MKRKQRREQVLTCAAEVFAEQGYHQTTIQDIITRAGIARGTFYLYFQDKRSIFDELLDRMMVSLRQRIVRIDPSLSPNECVALLRKNIQAIFEITLEHRALAKILLSDAVGLDPEFDLKLLGFYSNITEMIERSLRRGQASGLVRPCDVRLTAIPIIGAFKELMYQTTMRDLDLEISAVVEALLQLFRDGVLQRG